ncbi:MAG: hypothetical protein II629_09000 [Ruminococcus sp.]|nr:hypothetical protein [Ruminococcus sp.]
MSVFREAVKDAAIWSALLLAMPASYCVAVAVKAVWKEVMNRWLGKNC